MKAEIVYTGGVVETRSLEHRDLFKQLYAIMECEMIQPVPLPDGRVMLVDEEGLLSAMGRTGSRELNPLASALAGQRIVGHVAIMAHKDFYRE